MTGTVELLRELHRIHQQLHDLRERLNRGPKQIKAREDVVARLGEAVTSVQTEAKQARVAADQKQLLLKAGEERIKGLRAKLNAAASNREYQALKDQIAADEMANSVLADEALEMMDKIDKAKATVGEAEANLAKGKGELDALKKQVNQQRESLQGDVTRLEGELKTAEASLPPDIRADYLRVVSSKGSDGMAQVEHGSCGGCFQQITANMDSDLRLSRVVFCKSCGRLLYPPEDRSIG
jgi:predicted  nucleic acid-binding Zn-ribbon protein